MSLKWSIQPSTMKYVIAQVADFGQAEIMPDNTCELFTADRGTPGFTAPELAPPWKIGHGLAVRFGGARPFSLLDGFRVQIDEAYPQGGQRDALAKAPDFRGARVCVNHRKFTT